MSSDRTSDWSDSPFPFRLPPPANPSGRDADGRAGPTASVTSEEEERACGRPEAVDEREVRRASTRDDGDAMMVKRRGYSDHQSHHHSLVTDSLIKMFARSLNTTSRALTRSTGQQVRFNSSLPIPPKIATPKSLQGPGGNSARMEEVVDFYKALPKGEIKLKKGPFTNPGNGKPILFTIGTLFLIGYTLEYQHHLKHHKNHAH